MCGPHPCPLLGPCAQTAHVGALYSAFLAMMVAAHVPPPLALLSLAFTANIFGGITHYSAGQSAIYYSAGDRSSSSLFS